MLYEYSLKMTLLENNRYKLMMKLKLIEINQIIKIF